MNSDTPAAPPSLLRLKKISKSFPGVKALSDVDLTIRAGEVHALMGENGAGKSTLIKVLTGVYQRDGGVIELEGQAINPASPLEAQQCGISTVYQEVNLIPYLSVAENISLGRQPKKWGALTWSEIHARAERALQKLDVEIDVGRELSTYSIAIQQLVAIARALDISAKVLILDEPTSSLDAKEVARLFQVLAKLKQQGLGIIFVTHFLDQVYAISDRITVLRNGRLVGEYETSSLPRLELISRMIGKNISEAEHYSSPDTAGEKIPQPAPFLRARGLGKKNFLAPVDLEVRKGEILGLAGLLGSGRTETARLLFGLEAADRGEIKVDDRPVKLRSPRKAIACKFGFSPEDRKTEGIIPNLNVRQNIVLALQAIRGVFRPLSAPEQERIADQYITALNIMPPDANRPIKLLSGGNQQKALLGRWLAAQPRFLILDEPTRGIDVGAKFEIEKLMHQLAREGMAVLLISSELEEVVRNSHRVIVLRDRQKIAELAGSDISEPAILKKIAATEQAGGLA